MTKQLKNKHIHMKTTKDFKEAIQARADIKTFGSITRYIEDLIIKDLNTIIEIERSE